MVSAWVATVGDEPAVLFLFVPYPTEPLVEPLSVITVIGVEGGAAACRCGLNDDPRFSGKKWLIDGRRRLRLRDSFV